MGEATRNIDHRTVLAVWGIQWGIVWLDRLDHFGPFQSALVASTHVPEIGHDWCRTYLLGVSEPHSWENQCFFHGPTNALNELRITKGMWTTRIPPNTLKWTLRFLLNTLELGCLCISHSWAEAHILSKYHPIQIVSPCISIYLYRAHPCCLYTVTLLLVKSPLYLLKSPPYVAG